MVVAARGSYIHTSKLKSFKFPYLICHFSDPKLLNLKSGSIHVLRNLTKEKTQTNDSRYFPTVNTQFTDSDSVKRTHYRHLFLTSNFVDEHQGPTEWRCSSAQVGQLECNSATGFWRPPSMLLTTTATGSNRISCGSH